MPRYTDPTPQYFDSQGKTLAEGKLYFYDSGSGTKKDIWVDSAKTIPAENPVPLYGDGRVPPVFLDGAYRVVLQDKSGAQIWERDPVSANLDAPFGADWSADVVYPISSVVREDDKYWRSLVANNFGNRPSTDGGVNWLEVSFVSGTLGSLALENVAPVSMGGTGGTTAETGRAGLGLDVIGIYTNSAPAVGDANADWKGFSNVHLDSASTNLPVAKDGSLVTLKGNGVQATAQAYFPFDSATPRMWLRGYDPIGLGGWEFALMSNKTNQVPDDGGSLRRCAWVSEVTTVFGSFTNRYWYHVVDLTANLTITTVPAVGAKMTLYNTSASSKTIGVGGGLTLSWYQGGSVSSGTRTIASYSRVEILAITATNLVITGIGIS